MAIRANDVHRDACERLKSQAKELEKWVDARLWKNYDVGSGRAIVDLDGSGYKQEIIPLIQELYGKAGWHVTYEDDQHDGAYLVFERVEREDC